MSHLLHVTRWKFEAVTKGGVPLYIEFPVHPDTAPYLVTSTQGLLWIEQPVGQAEGEDQTPLVRAAVREATLPEVFMQVVAEVLQKGQERKWGNTFPLTVEGLVAAKAHLAFYDLLDIDILAPKLDQDPARVLLQTLKAPYHPCGWLPAGTLVLVPKDRTFVGVVGRLTPKKAAGVIHNAARGMAIVSSSVPVPAPKGKKGSRK